MEELINADNFSKHTSVCELKKNHTFVQYESRKPITFMVIKELEESYGQRTVCIVSWYMLTAKGLNVQARFPMAAIDGQFCNFRPIPHKIFVQAVSEMRNCDSELKTLDIQEHRKNLIAKCRKKLIRMIK